MQLGQILDTNESYNLVKNTVIFRKLFIIYISMKNTDIEVVYGDNLFEKKDLEKIRNWLFNESHKVYKDDFFRLDLNDYILFFKKYLDEDNKELYLVGHMIDQSIMSRLLFLELRQDYLEEQLH